jgi:hypothetical protein
MVASWRRVSAPSRWRRIVPNVGVIPGYATRIAQARVGLLSIGASQRLNNRIKLVFPPLTRSDAIVPLKTGAECRTRPLLIQ